MATVLTATFDGAVLRLDKPLRLPPNTRVRITVEPESRAGENRSFLSTASSLDLQGPPDWSNRLEDYLYGEAPGQDEWCSSTLLLRSRCRRLPTTITTKPWSSRSS